MLTYEPLSHVKTLVCLLEIITRIRAGRRPTGWYFNMCRKSRMTSIKAEGAGLVAESWSVTGVKCRDFTAELLKGDVFVLAA